MVLGVDRLVALLRTEFQLPLGLAPLGGLTVGSAAHF